MRRFILVFYLYTLTLLSFTYFYNSYLEIVEQNRPKKFYKNIIEGLVDVFSSIPEGLAQWAWYQIIVFIISLLFILSLRIFVFKFRWFWILPFALLIYFIGFIITLFLFYFPGIEPWESWYIEVIGLLVSAGILTKSIFFSKASSEYY